ncbi:MAG: pyridoxamine kinase [Clostridiales bacterium]|jgi:pyridoxine kinase|nr:pyridoxamine kinase [Clostridiales bacterium]MDR2752367.1 pyridoxamine kinase [Clostridiales bacterium]
MERQKKVMAIHDISCVGRCSLTVALPILSAAGFDCGVLPTAVLSTHTGGFTGFTYRDLTEDITPIASHWQSLGLKFDSLYSGFLGSFDQIDLVAKLFEDFKAEDGIVLVDPVMADNGKLYSIYTPDMAKGMSKLCAKADIIAPNLTEAAFLLDEPYVGESYDKPYIEGLLKRLSTLGCKKVVLTGVSFDPGLLGAACYDSATGDIDFYFNKKIDGYFHGTGDVFSSAILSAALHGKSMPEAIRVAVDYTLKCIELTVELDLERRYGVCFELALPLLISLLQ